MALMFLHFEHNNQFLKVFQMLQQLYLLLDSIYAKTQIFCNKIPYDINLPKLTHDLFMLYKLTLSIIRFILT